MSLWSRIRSYFMRGAETLDPARADVRVLEEEPDGPEHIEDAVGVPPPEDEQPGGKEPRPSGEESI